MLTFNAQAKDGVDQVSWVRGSQVRLIHTSRFSTKSRKQGNAYLGNLRQRKMSDQAEWTTSLTKGRTLLLVWAL